MRADAGKLNVKHNLLLSERFRKFLYDTKTSDLTLKVEEELIPAHRIILASSCDYFSRLLYGNMSESDRDEIVLKDIPLDAFKMIMGYIYTGTLESSEEGGFDKLMRVLALAHQYGLEKLQAAICQHLRRTLSVQTALVVFEASLRFRLHRLKKFCQDFLDENAAAILQSDSFLHASATVVEQMLARDTFCAREIDIFKAVERWISEQPNDDEALKILARIRLSYISVGDLANHVWKSGLIESDRLLAAIQELTESHHDYLGFRCSIETGKNIAAAVYGAKVLTGWGAPREAILEQDNPQNSGMASEWLSHSIGDGLGIVVKLDKPFCINVISMDLHSSPSSFSVGVSLNGKDWLTVIDHSEVPCNSAIRMSFKPQVVRYVAVTGTQGSGADSKTFKLGRFEAFFIPMPEKNVGSPQAGARIIGDRGSLEDAFVVGSSLRDPVKKVFCKSLADFPILVELMQLYLVDFIQIRFWDGSTATYSYFVETSTEGSDWTRIATFEKEPNHLWQIMKFKPSVVKFIKIGVSAIIGFGNRYVELECRGVGFAE